MTATRFGRGMHWSQPPPWVNRRFGFDNNSLTTALLRSQASGTGKCDLGILLFRNMHVFNAELCAGIKT